MEQSKCSSSSASLSGRETKKGENRPSGLSALVEQVINLLVVSLSTRSARLRSSLLLWSDLINSHEKGGKVRSFLRWCRKNYSSEIAGLSTRVDSEKGHGAVDLLSYLYGLCSPCENAAFIFAT